MKTGIRLVITIILCLVFAGGSYFLASALMDGIYQYRSPLDDHAPVPGLSMGEPVARQVVFVLIDALRYDTSLDADLMPVLNQLRAQGAAAEMHSKTPSYSSPGYGVLITGAWPELSDSPAFNLDYEDIPAIKQDNIFSSAHRLGKKTAVSGFNWFEKLIPQEAVDAGFYTAGEDKAADRDVVDAALPWVQSGDYQLILIHIDQVDYAGHHEGGPQGENWSAAAARADALLGEILAKMDLSRDVIFVCSDHGQIDQGGHGGQDAVVLVEPFVLAGNGIKSGDFGNVNMTDVAPTLAAIMGINIPAAAQGQVRSEMISGLSKTLVDQLPLISARQQSILLKAYSDSIGVPVSEALVKVDANKPVQDYQNDLVDLRQKRLNRERAVRIGIALAAALVTGALFYRWKPKEWKRLILAALVYTLLFNAYYLVLGARLYSFSVVAGQMSLVVNNGVAALVAYLLVWFIFWRPKQLNQSKMETAIYGLRLSVVTTFVTAIPLFAYLVWNGFNPGWMLPTIGLLYLAILSLVQIIFISAGGLVMSGISIWFVKSKKETVAI